MRTLGLIPILLGAWLATAAAQGTKDVTQSASEPEAIPGFSGDPLSRVVGGQPAKQDKWPSFVSVVHHLAGDKTSGLCGGTVIASDWVLTAAHCVSGRQPKNLFVWESGVQLTGRESIDVDRIVVHERYSSEPFSRNDIALVHLKKAAAAPPQMLISQAASLTVLYNGLNTSVAGFGNTKARKAREKAGGSLADQLMEAELPFVERASCNRTLKRLFGRSSDIIVDASAICAGDISGRRDSCNGDSGGPLVVDIEGRRVQVGIVSWGPGCAQRDTVGIYAGVGYFERWIRAYVPNASFYQRDAPVVAEAPAPPARPEPPSVPAASSPAPARPEPPAPPQPAAAPPVPEPAAAPVAVAAIESAAGALGPAEGRLSIAMAEGDRPSVGSLVHVRVKTAIAGQLLVYNVDLVSGTAYQVFPNAFSGRGKPGETALQASAGDEVTIPGPSDSFRFRIKAPSGPNRLYAFVLPPSVKVEDLAARGLAMQDLPDAPRLFSELASRAIRGIDVEKVETAIAGLADRGAAVFPYEIMP